MYRPHKPLPVRDEPQHKEEVKPQGISIERADGTIEVIKEA